MLEKLPAVAGRALGGVHAGAENLVVADTALTGINAQVELRSAAFGYNEAIPARYTADGIGVSPPLQWSGVPTDAASVVLIVEDADSPTPHPLVHAIVWDLPGVDAELPEGALGRSSDAQSSEAMGKNSYLRAAYLPPDPPPGHGVHRYVFQLFAVDIVLRFDSPPGRAAIVDALRDHVLAKGLLIGTYGRD